MNNLNMRSITGYLYPTVLTSFMFLAIVFVTAGNISAQEFFYDAFANAAKPPQIGGGGKWVVTAKVSLQASGKEYLSARGPVTLQPDGMLGGDLSLSIDNNPVANNTLRLNIRNSDPAAIVLVRNVSGRPFLGRPASQTSLPLKPEFNYLSGSINWPDGQRVIRIDLESEYVKAPPPPPKRAGARYQIGGFMRVTNSEDGWGGADNTLELYGRLYLHRVRDGKQIKTWVLVDVPEQDAENGFERKFYDNIFIDVYDDELTTDKFTMENGFSDRDRGQGLSGDDVLFNGITCMNGRLINYLLSSTKRYGSMECKGDQNSESADIRIFMKKVSDL